jgi:hypothetical protein
MTILETPALAPADALRRRVRGAVVRPGDGGWDDARRAYNLAIEQEPVAVVFPVDATDVASVVAVARKQGLRVAPQRTGHNAAPLGPLDDTILLKTDALHSVEIDAAARRARVGAGVKWEHVVPRASELGLAALHGSTPDVSIVGYSLGGGLGWYGRKHGLAANSVTALEFVTADGRLVRADHEQEPDLFWAARGGGGNFGVVTAIEFGLYAIPEVYAGVLFFPWERSAEVLHAWHEWLPSTPDEVTSVGRMLQFPPLPIVPEQLRGKSFAVVEAVFIGSESEGRDLLRPLRDLGPAVDTFAMVPPVGLGELHMDPPDPVPYVSDHLLLGPLPATAIDELVAVAGPGSGSPLVSVELRQLGGALARSAPHHGALGALPGEFAMFGVGVAADGAMTSANEAQLTRLTRALAPYDVARYLNFTEQPVPASSFFGDETLARLRAVKTSYDPDGLFLANHRLEEGS